LSLYWKAIIIISIIVIIIIRLMANVRYFENNQLQFCSSFRLVVCCSACLEYLVEV